MGGWEGEPAPPRTAVLSSPAVREEAMIASFTCLERAQIRTIWASVELTSLSLPIDLATHALRPSMCDGYQGFGPDSSMSILGDG